MGSAWAIEHAREKRPDVGGACLPPTLRAISLVAGAGPLRPEEVLARCPHQVKAQNKHRTWIPLAVGLQKSWLWPMVAGRRGYPFNSRLVTPGPWGSLPLPFPVGTEKPSHQCQPLCRPSLREGLCSPWDEVPSCSALTIREEEVPQWHRPWDKRCCPATSSRLLQLLKESRALSKTHSLLEGEARTPTQAVWPELRWCGGHGGAPSELAAPETDHRLALEP